MPSGHSPGASRQRHRIPSSSCSGVGRSGACATGPRSRKTDRMSSRSNARRTSSSVIATSAGTGAPESLYQPRTRSISARCSGPKRLWLAAFERCSRQRRARVLLPTPASMIRRSSGVKFARPSHVKVVASTLATTQEAGSTGIGRQTSSDPSAATREDSRGSGAPPSRVTATAQLSIARGILILSPLSERLRHSRAPRWEHAPTPLWRIHHSNSDELQPEVQDRDHRNARPEQRSSERERPLGRRRRSTHRSGGTPVRRSSKLRARSTRGDAPASSMRWARRRPTEAALEAGPVAASWMGGPPATS